MQYSALLLIYVLISKKILAVTVLHPLIYLSVCLFCLHCLGGKKNRRQYIFIEHKLDEFSIVISFSSAMLGKGGFSSFVSRSSFKGLTHQICLKEFFL